MSLAYYARNAASAERARRRMQREGVTMKGQKLWTQEEDSIVRQLAPDYDAIHRKLSHRTRVAIRTRCRKFGLGVRTQRNWTAAEVSKLRRLYPTAPKQELCETFSYSTWTNIQQLARYHGFRRRKRPFKPTGNPPVDEMLVKLFQANFSFTELDKELRTKRYFAQGKWRYVRPNYNRLVKAIELLDGELAVRWKDE